MRVSGGTTTGGHGHASHKQLVKALRKDGAVRSVLELPSTPEPTNSVFQAMVERTVFEDACRMQRSPVTGDRTDPDRSVTVDECKEYARRLFARLRPAHTEAGRAGPTPDVRTMTMALSSPQPVAMEEEDPDEGAPLALTLDSRSPSTMAPIAARASPRLPPRTPREVRLEDFMERDALLTKLTAEAKRLLV